MKVWIVLYDRVSLSDEQGWSDILGVFESEADAQALHDQEAAKDSLAHLYLDIKSAEVTPAK